MKCTQGRAIQETVSRPVDNFGENKRNNLFKVNEGKACFFQQPFEKPIYINKNN